MEQAEGRTNPMLEKCARAIRDARALPGTKPVARVSDVDRRAARAVLQALRDPTPEVIEAGQAVDGTITAEHVWQAMLTTAQKEG